MRDLLSVDRDANAIRMLRSADKNKTFLLLEGSSDKVFYEHIVNKLVCQLIVLSGKPSSKLRVISVLEILDKSNFQGVLAIVDADFDRITNSEDYQPNLFRTDTHDLETMIINSPAFDKLISEFGSEEKILKFNQDIKLAILKSGILIGYLRLISQCDGLNLTFNSIKFSQFIDKQTLQINELQLIREIKNKSQALSLKDEELQHKLTSQKSNNYDPWQVCCGHDLVEILSIALQKAIGSNKATDVELNTLERSLRLAYEKIYFHNTQLYSNICIWESNNQPFKVF